MPDHSTIPAECVTWDVTLEAVLHSLLIDGVEVVTIELHGEPDSNGRVRLTVMPVATDNANELPKERAAKTQLDTLNR